MSVIKGKKEDKLLLDFSDQQYSKNKIRKSLKAAEVTTVISDGKMNRFIQYYIKVGMYTVWLWLPANANGKLKDCDIQFSIHDNKGALPIMSDGRFRNQYWTRFESVTINNLVDIIAHCQRLNGLNAFL